MPRPASHRTDRHLVRTAARRPCGSRKSSQPSGFGRERRPTGARPLRGARRRSSRVLMGQRPGPTAAIRRRLDLDLDLELGVERLLRRGFDGDPRVFARRRPPRRRCAPRSASRGDRLLVRNSRATAAVASQGGAERPDGNDRGRSGKVSATSSPMGHPVRRRLRARRAEVPRPPPACQRWRRVAPRCSTSPADKRRRWRHRISGSSSRRQPRGYGR
jgi:hypothetical protein